MSLLVVGSLALDTIETHLQGGKNHGGSATFISVAASYFTQPVRLVGVVGGDFPKKELEYFEEREIDLEGLQIKEDGKTFHWQENNYDLNTIHCNRANVFADLIHRSRELQEEPLYVGQHSPSLRKAFSTR
jgi:sugar/nucleoside kinase (ribokinase family)